MSAVVQLLSLSASVSPLVSPLVCDNIEKYVAEDKSGEGGHLFEKGKLTD